MRVLGQAVRYDLRHDKKPELHITWDMNRGEDVGNATWTRVCNVQRINDRHLTLAEKRAARGKS